MVAGLLALVACVNAIANPDALRPSSIAEVLGGWPLYTWAALYGLGGLLIVAGGIARRTDLEEPGLRLFIAGMAVNAFAILALRGGASAVLTIAPYAAFGWIAVGRIRDLKRQRDAVTDLAQASRKHEPLAVLAPVLFTLGAAPVLPVAGAGTPDPTNPLVAVILIALTSGTVSAIIGFVGQRRAAADNESLNDEQTRKVRAEAGNVMDQRWKRIVDELDRQLEERDEALERLRGELDEVRTSEEECERRAGVLEHRLEEVLDALSRRGIRVAGTD